MKGDCLKVNLNGWCIVRARVWLTCWLNTCFCLLLCQANTTFVCQLILCVQFIYLGLGVVPAWLTYIDWHLCQNFKEKKVKIFLYSVHVCYLLLISWFSLDKALPWVVQLLPRVPSMTPWRSLTLMSLLRGWHQEKFKSYWMSVIQVRDAVNYIFTFMSSIASKNVELLP